MAWTAAGLAAVVLAGAGALAWSGRGGDAPRPEGAAKLVEAPDELDWEVTDNPEKYYTKTGEVVPDPDRATKDVPSYYADDCQLRPGDTQVRTGCDYGDRDGKETMALLGDSKMGQWFPAVEEIALAEGWKLDLYLKSACTFSLDGVDKDCAAFARNVLDYFKEHGAPDYALISRGNDRVNGQEKRFGTVDAIRELEQMGTQIVLIADNPMPDLKATYDCVDENPENYLVCGFDREPGNEGDGTELLDRAANRLDLPLVNLNDWICPPTDRCPVVIENTLIYRQGSHLTASYVETLTPMLHRQLSDLGIADKPVEEISPSDMPLVVE